MATYSSNQTIALSSTRYTNTANTVLYTVPSNRYARVAVHKNAAGNLRIDGPSGTLTLPTKLTFDASDFAYFLGPGESLIANAGASDYTAIVVEFRNSP